MSAYPNDRLLGISQFQYSYSYFLIPRTTRLVYLEKKVIWATVAFGEENSRVRATKYDM